MTSFLKCILRRTAALTCLLAVPVAAIGADAVRVTDPWVRATVPGQKVAGAYMDITSPTDAQLVGVSSPVAGAAQVHSMQMEGGVMKMRAVETLQLPAGKSVKLAPGGYHVMLFDLTRPLGAGDKVPLTLSIREDAGKREQKIAVTAIVRSRSEEAGGHEHH